MILEFSVKNFRSIKDLQTISFAATGLKSPNAETDENNIAHLPSGQSILKTIGIYGPNAGGKTNLIKALCQFIALIKDGLNKPAVLSKLYQPNFYNEDENEGCYFQIIFILDGKKYRYGLVVKKNDEIQNPGDMSYSPCVIDSEWLMGQAEKNMTTLFIRKGMEVVSNSLSGKNGKIPENLPYKHTLFLSYAVAFDSEIANKIQSFCSGRFLCEELSLRGLFRALSISFVKDTNLKKQLLKWLESFNLSYDDIRLTGDEEDDNKVPYPLDKILLVKKLDNGKEILLNLSHNESSGTKKMFDLAGVMFLALKNNMSPFFIVIDEIDDSFHPSLLIKLVEAFNDNEINEVHSQLLFTSHDTNLLDPNMMRRDQIYFVEKQSNNSSKIYSLADLKGVRNNSDFAKHYLAGFYGATPVLSKFVNEEDDDE